MNVAHLYYRMYARNGCKGTGFHRNEQFIAWIFARWLKLFNIMTCCQTLVVSTCKCTARKVKEYFRKNTQKEYENLIFLLGDGLFCQ